MAYFLVVYRVTTGRGWTNQTEQKLTSLQWNHASQASVGGFSGIPQLPVTTTRMVVDSLPVVHPISESAV